MRSGTGHDPTVPRTRESFRPGDRVEAHFGFSGWVPGTIVRPSRRFGMKGWLVELDSPKWFMRRVTMAKRGLRLTP
jgi:hypothetical protein